PHRSPDRHVGCRLHEVGLEPYLYSYINRTATSRASRQTPKWIPAVIIGATIPSAGPKCGTNWLGAGEPGPKLNEREPNSCEREKDCFPLALQVRFIQGCGKRGRTAFGLDFTAKNRGGSSTV